ncbi:YeeE/YedE family protein [Citreimonas sp.]|uniref:YeeE/YedE family protein n=1 Tax=Citreimonas sp. TaxID=3036715 RepID=UPI0035C87BD6
MEQDWLWGLFGGLMIGTGGAIYLLGNGRIMGASGIIGGLADGSGRNTAAERVTFLAGVAVVPALLTWVFGPVATNITENFAVLIIAGLLVGIGTRLANGCTSGHGVCGMSRLSPRSFVATALYILAGGLGVVLFRHVLGVI